MFEQLDEILADVAGAAAGRAAAPGAGAARKRGRQRRMRRQLTATTALSLALLGGLGLVGAVGAMAFRGGDSSSSGASAGISGVGTLPAPAPNRYVAGAWLSQSQLPYAGTIAWKVNPQVLGTDLHGAVQLVLPGDSFFDSIVDGFGTYCSIPGLADGASANQLESFYGPITGSALPSIPGIPADVDQSAAFYRSRSAAASAWDTIGSGFAACAEFATGRVSGESETYPSVGTASRIVNEPDVQCWTNLAAVSNIGTGSAVTDFLDEVCFVRRGTVIGIVDLGFEGPSTLAGVDFRPVDERTVSDLQQALNAYGGN